MRELSYAEVDCVSGAGWLNVSGETWGCAIGGAAGGYLGGPVGGAAGCIAGAALVNNYGGSSSVTIGPAQALYVLTLLN